MYTQVNKASALSGGLCNDHCKLDECNQLLKRVRSFCQASQMWTYNLARVNGVHCGRTYQPLSVEKPVNSRNKIALFEVFHGLPNSALRASHLRFCRSTAGKEVNVIRRTSL